MTDHLTPPDWIDHPDDPGPTPGDNPTPASYVAPRRRHEPEPGDADDTVAHLTRQANRPVIPYVDCELPRIVDMACRALVEAGAQIYSRDTSLVRPVAIRGTARGNLMRSDGVTILVPVTKAGLVELLTAVINWQRYDARKGDYKPISCPSVVAETILARQGDWPFPQLVAVVSAPTVRHDGTILNLTGFDRETGILFASDLDWPMVPAQPSKANAQAALADLRDLLGSFPFVDTSDRSAALAMILTAVARPGLPTSPMFGISAPTPGTGKSKLVDIAAILATGQTASVLSAPREEAEMQKQVGAVLMAGDAFITLDNIEYPLRSEFLCQVLTQGGVAVRVLGESRTLKLSTVVTVCATGNSLRFAGDLTRRVVLINLDARMERPEERVFDTDVIAVTKAQRVHLVTAALTVLRAFVVQRGLKITPSLGSFEAWSNLIRSALMWLGEADPLGNATKVRENDPERERTAAIIACLPENRAWTVAEIGCDAGSESNVREALAEFFERGGAFSAMRFGHFLRKNTDRIIDGKKIVNCGKDRNKIALWSVERLEEQEFNKGGLW